MAKKWPAKICRTGFQFFTAHLFADFLSALKQAKARSLKATLVTGNGSEFKRVKGLKVREWKPA